MSELTTTTTLSMPEAEAAVRVALANEGFGVLTEIDVAATFKAKLDVEYAPLKVLGACNPALAHEALSLDERAVFVLPCNVVLRAAEGVTTITAVDPGELMSDPAFASLTQEARARLARALEAVAQA